MSLGVSLFILLHAINNFQSIIDLFLEKTPKNISIDKLKEVLLIDKDIIDVHHVHIWSIDGNSNYATIHVVTDINDTIELKKKIRKKCLELGISHITIELENTGEHCNDLECHVELHDCGHNHNH